MQEKTSLAFSGTNENSPPLLPGLFMSIAIAAVKRSPAPEARHELAHRGSSGWAKKDPSPGGATPICSTTLCLRIKLKGC